MNRLVLLALPWLAKANRDGVHDVLKVHEADHSSIDGNPISQYQYVKQWTGSIVANSNWKVVNNVNKDVTQGEVLFYMMGTCPYNVFWGMPCKEVQVVAVAIFQGKVVCYWTKEQLPETVNRYEKGKNKNDSGQFTKLSDQFKDGQIWNVANTGPRERVVLMGPNQDPLYVYMLYAKEFTFEMAKMSGTMDGWILYQKNPSETKYYAQKIHVDETFAITFKDGVEKPLGEEFWPKQEDMAI